MNEPIGITFLRGLFLTVVGGSLLFIVFWASVAFLSEVTDEGKKPWSVIQIPLFIGAMILVGWYFK